MNPSFARCVALVMLIFFSSSCKEDSTAPTRNFYLGFTPFPYDVSLQAVEETYSNITTLGDIINHHFDNGVPWVEALSGEPFSANIQNDWTYRKNSTPASMKVVVSASALNTPRNAKALYRGESDDMPLPGDWATYTFSDSRVKTAYLNYCKRLIDFFEPDYFNMNVEANLLYILAPDDFPGFLEFHKYVYQELKIAYPTLPVFCSITGAHILEGFFNFDSAEQKGVALELLESSDLFGISFYPHLSKYLGNQFPTESYDELFGLSDKPIAIAETGYPAQTFNVYIDPSTLVTIESDEGKQSKFFEDMFRALSKYDAEFVIDFAVRDYDQLWVYMGSKEDITIAWRDIGFLDEAGRQRKAYQTWKAYFERKLVE